jgi:hypothetical protein
MVTGNLPGTGNYGETPMAGATVASATARLSEVRNHLSFNQQHNAPVTDWALKELAAVTADLAAMEPPPPPPEMHASSSKHGRG